MYYKKKKFLNKKTIMIVSGILALIILGILVTVIINNLGKQKEKSQVVTEQKSEPVLEIKKDTEAPNVEKVVLTVTAKTDDPEGINYILLPNGTKVNGDQVTYQVNVNDKYKFATYGKNGKYAEKTIEVNNIKIAKANEPYIPVGFKHVENTKIETGFVIEDKNGNQYVWIPVENGQMYGNPTNDNKFSDTNQSSNTLTNSVGRYKGFYVSRYESSQGLAELDGKKYFVASSKKGVYPWVNISYNDAQNVALNTAKLLKYTDIETSIMTSYGWFTMLNWIDTTNKRKVSQENANQTNALGKTGADSADIFNNIADIKGNVKEWTTEIHTQVQQNTANSNEEQSLPKYMRVLRGGNATIPQSPSKATVHPDNQKSEYWGFRTVLYKK